MNRTRGFSLIEILVLLALLGGGLAIFLPSIDAAADFQYADNALETVKMQLRMGRQLAVDKRRLHRVSFQGTIIKLERLDGSSGPWTEVSQLPLTQGFSFQFASGVPISGSGAPDEMDADQPVDFADQLEIFFRPNGSAVDRNGQIVSGIVHLSRNQTIETARAVSVFGSTGRIKGWRYLKDGAGTWAWK